MNGATTSERIQTVIIGGGQAGLSTGYHLAKSGLPFVILDASDRIGDSWRNRWDSLRLFTPARYDGLPGMSFPAPAQEFPTKNEIADYLEEYAARFDLPVRSGVRVDRLSKLGDNYIVEAGNLAIEAENVVVALGNYQTPQVPQFASDLNSNIVQMHSNEYRNPSQLQDGGVLLVGAGNSGSEIAMELASKHEIWMSGRDTGHIPFRIEGLAGRLLGVPLVIGFVFHHLLAVSTPVGRKVRPKLLHATGLVVRVKPKDIADAGIERVPRTVGVQDGLPVLEDGRVLQVSNVIWCTGFGRDFSWIDLPVFGEEEEPKEPLHDRGIVVNEPGLYFVGLFFLYAPSSPLLRGVGRDAKRVVKAIASRVSADLTPANKGQVPITSGVGVGIGSAHAARKL